MPIVDDIRERVPGPVFDDRDCATHYYLQEGKVLFRHSLVRGADVESFRFYLGAFAKDCRNCYVVGRRLVGGNGPTFRALNLTWATDGKSVWALGGKVKDCDAETFVVCDDGSYDIGSHLGWAIQIRVPHGFGKDKARVYYYDFDGTPSCVRKADPASFISFNDGFFGRDEKSVFCGAFPLPKVRVEHWVKLGCGFSRDDSRIYFHNRLMSEADYNTFEVVETPDSIPLAKDCRNFYINSTVITAAEFARFLEGPRDGGRL